jgi:hypothetical protein
MRQKITQLQNYEITNYNAAMRTSLILLVTAAALLTACNTSTSAPSSVAAKSGETAQSADTSKSNDPVQQKLQDTAGQGATDCGRVKSLSQDQIKTASDCAINAAKDKHAFYVAYDMPGLTVGVAGNSQGKLFAIQSEPPENAPVGAKAEVKSTPCPGDLRVANSGRVTCMTPGSGMGTVGGANPHGGMPPATGENPHGGISMPSLDAAKPSHPPASKKPPKQ